MRDPTIRFTDVDACESQVVREWIEEARREARLDTVRTFLQRCLKRKFGDSVPHEITNLINQQNSVEMLTDWFDAALHAQTFQDFIAVLRQ